MTERQQDLMAFEKLTKTKESFFKEIGKVIKFLKEFGLPAIKIASIDLNYFQLHEKIIKYKMPTIISTGMGLEKEIKDIVSFYKKNRKLF